ncbi:unnamed protein product [Anisakis simplex]|uniref:CUB domain-containing protein n=1 Tax=Anisakis simplex TaxID=6269 RepID=A0A158PPN4_ANISI|nr:unnamed protein product [Anisakis simplex]
MLQDDTCLLILSHILSIDKAPHLSHVSRLINMKYNCSGWTICYSSISKANISDRCTIQCENGGSINDNCECECSYGFEGDRCQLLTKRKLFTDPSCGQVDTSQQSVISLSSYPDSASGSTFCQWLVRGSLSESIEFEIADLDLDADNMLPGQKCNDLFYIWGSAQITNPVNCDPKSVQSLQGIKYKSDTNWLLIELRMNPWSERPHKGPFIKFRLVDSPMPQRESSPPHLEYERIEQTLSCKEGIHLS